MRLARDVNDAVFFADVTVIITVLCEEETPHKIFQISRLVVEVRGRTLDVLSQDDVL